MHKKILIIDDEEDLAHIVKLNLEELGGYKVRVETRGIEAIAAVEKFKPDLILLDIKLPDMSGFEICRVLKDKDKVASVPVMIVSGKKEEPDKILGLNIGADDYIEKPFSIKELDARIKAVLRRTGKGPVAEEINVGDMISIFPQNYEVKVLGKTIKLTNTEFLLLKLLASKKSFVFSRSRILDYLRGSPEAVTERTIDVHVRHLREKLGEAAKFIKNVRGVGYKIEE